MCGGLVLQKSQVLLHENKPLIQGHTQRNRECMRCLHMQVSVIVAFVPFPMSKFTWRKKKKRHVSAFFSLCNSDKAAVLTAAIHCTCILQMIYIITQQVDLKVYQAHRVALCHWFVPNQWPLITKFAEEFIVRIYSFFYCNTVTCLVKYYPPEQGLRGLKENTCNSPVTISCSNSTFTSLQPSICPNIPQLCWGKRIILLLPIES